MTGSDATPRWLRFSITLGLASICSILPARGSTEEYNPFRIPRAEFFDWVDTIALWPLELPIDTEKSDDTRIEIERLLSAALESAGYRVVPSTVIEPRWRELSQLVGGVVDPVTGETNGEQVSLLRSILGHELATEHGVDALLATRIRHGRMQPWAQRRLNPASHQKREYTIWMGAHEPTTWRGEPIRSLWLNRPNRLIGPRFSVNLYDLHGIELFDAMVPIRWERVYVAGAYDEREKKPLLDEPERIRSVITSLVEPLDRSTENPDSEPPPSEAEPNVEGAPESEP